VGSCKKVDNHAVPKFYLRNFGNPVGGRKIRIFRIEARQHIENASIKDQCARPYFYGRTGQVEEDLAELENAVSPVIREILRSELVPPPGSEQLDLLLAFVVLQEGRTFAAAAREDAASTHLSRALFALDPAVPEALRKNLNELQFRYEKPALVSLQRTAQCFPLIRDLRLKVLRNDSRVDFITSDAPVVIHNHWGRRCSHFSPIGLISSGLQIFCPLSPRFLAVLYDTDVYSIGRSRDDIVVIAEASEIRSLNALQVASATENLYYSSASMVTEIDRMPMNLRKPIELQHPVQTLKEEDGSSYLVTYSRRPHSVTLAVPTIRIRDEARRVPHEWRSKQYRPEAEALANYLFPRQEPQASAGTSTPTKYVACDEDDAALWHRGK